MNEQGRQVHACAFSPEELRALKQFCALLQNGGLKSFRALLDFGDVWLRVRSAAVSAIVTLTISAIGVLLTLGVYLWVRL